jgi:hypothetical protein
MIEIIEMQYELFFRLFLLGLNLISYTSKSQFLFDGTTVLYIKTQL